MSSGRSGRQWGGLVMVTSTLLFAIAPVWSSPARAAECTWTVDPVGRPRGFVWSIDARSASDAWAVGSEPGPDPGVPYRPAIHHWDGTSWTRTESPRQGTLTSVAAVAADDAWAVGFVGGRDRVIRQLYERWNGAHWTVVAPPEGRRGVVEDVVAVASDDVWAVGWNRPGP